MPAPLTPAEPRPALERPRRGGRADDLTLTALYEEHRSEILGFLVRMTRDREAAEDILQETFISLIAEAHAGRMPVGSDRGSTGRRPMPRSAAHAAGQV